MLDTLNIVPETPPPSGTPRPILTGLFTAIISVTGTEPVRAEFAIDVEGLPFFENAPPTTLHTGPNEVSRIFPLGAPFQLSLSLLQETGSVGGPPSNFPRSRAVDTTVRWEGISSVNGGDRFTVTSASGANWALAAPIPEPPIIALLAAGLVALGARRARRNSMMQPSSL